MKKRILSTALALALCLSLLPTGTAAAADPVPAADPPAGETTPVQPHQHTDHIGWTDLNSLDLSGNNADNPLPTNKYYLSANLTLEKTIFLAGDSTLCLNGHVLSGGGKCQMLNIGSGQGVTTICSCADATRYGYRGDETYVIQDQVPDVEGYDILPGGLLTGGVGDPEYHHGGAIYSQSPLEVYNCSFAGNDNLAGNGFHYGTALRAMNTLTMRGCTVAGNYGNYDIIEAESNFDLYDSRIANNRCSFYAVSAVNAHLHDGSTIINNLAAGICSPNTIQLSGAINISGNTFRDWSADVSTSWNNTDAYLKVNEGFTFAGDTPMVIEEREPRPVKVVSGWPESDETFHQVFAPDSPNLIIRRGDPEKGELATDLYLDNLPANVPPAPDSISSRPPEVPGGQGFLKGTTAAMEYATGPDFSDAQDCLEGSTPVDPSTYYIRFKADGDTPAGLPFTVTVENFALSISVRPSSGVCEYGTDLLLSSNSDLAEIYYTTDGTDPLTSETRTRYTQPIQLTQNITVKAAASCNGVNSEVMERIYTVRAPQPVISPDNPYFSDTLEVSITLPDPVPAGAVIYYTTDGTAPTTGSTKYMAPFTLTDTATVKAIAVADGLQDSIIADASYEKKALYSITVTNGTAINPDIIQKITSAPAGTTVELKKTPLLPQFRFNGWKVIKPASLVIDGSDTFTMPEEAVEIEAVYTPVTNVGNTGLVFNPDYMPTETVTFDACDGTVTYTPATETDPIKLTLEDADISGPIRFLSQSLNDSPNQGGIVYGAESAEPAITLELIGRNVISSLEAGNVTVTGSGDLIALDMLVTDSYKESSFTGKLDAVVSEGVHLPEGPQLCSTDAQAPATKLTVHGDPVLPELYRRQIVLDGQTVLKVPQGTSLTIQGSPRNLGQLDRLLVVDPAALQIEGTFYCQYPLSLATGTALSDEEMQTLIKGLNISGSGIVVATGDGSVPQPPILHSAALSAPPQPEMKFYNHQGNLMKSAEVLDFSQVTTNVSGDGYLWDAQGHFLLIRDLLAEEIILPEYTTVIVEGESTVSRMSSSSAQWSAAGFPEAIASITVGGDGLLHITDSLDTGILNVSHGTQLMLDCGSYFPSYLEVYGDLVAFDPRAQGEPGDSAVSALALTIYSTGSVTVPHNALSLNGIRLGIDNDPGQITMLSNGPANLSGRLTVYPGGKLQSDCANYNVAVYSSAEKAEEAIQLPGGALPQGQEIKILSASPSMQLYCIAPQGASPHKQAGDLFGAGGPLTVTSSPFVGYEVNWDNDTVSITFNSAVTKGLLTVMATYEAGRQTACEVLPDASGTRTVTPPELGECRLFLMTPDGAIRSDPIEISLAE